MFIHKIILISAYRSRAATFATDQSDQSQTQIPDRLANTTINEIAAEILGPNKTGQSLIKRSSRGKQANPSSDILLFRTLTVAYTE